MYLGKERSIFVAFDSTTTNEPFVHPYRDMRAHMLTHLDKVTHTPHDPAYIILDGKVSTRKYCIWVHAKEGVGLRSLGLEQQCGVDGIACIAFPFHIQIYLYVPTPPLCPSIYV
jgi:hypothetical protein